jgi:hypothetical protein
MEQNGSKCAATGNTHLFVTDVSDDSNSTGQMSLSTRLYRNQSVCCESTQHLSHSRANSHSSEIMPFSWTDKIVCVGEGRTY